MGPLVTLFCFFPMIMASVLIKTKKDIVSDNSLYVYDLLTIYPLVEHLCSSQCDKLTKGKANLKRYTRGSNACHCLFASHKFRDTREFAPNTEEVEFFVQAEVFEEHDKNFKQELLPILGARSSSPQELRNFSLPVTYAFDRWLSSNHERCFVSGDDQDGWAHFAIPLSRVAQVELLSRNDEFTVQMEGTTVNVCTNDLNCHDCGTANDPGGGEWAMLYCPEGTKGNKVKVVNPINYLQTCEIRVRGKVIEDEYKYIPILGANGDDPYHGHTHTILENSFDGFEDFNEYFCFIGNLLHNGWAHFQIPFSSVDHVMLLNRELGHSYQTSGTQVQVVWNNNSSFDCGTTSVTTPNTWIKFQCPPGTAGNLVTVTNALNHLNICELKVYGVNSQ